MYLVNIIAISSSSLNIKIRESFWNLIQKILQSKNRNYYKGICGRKNCAFSRSWIRQLKQGTAIRLSSVLSIRRNFSVSLLFSFHSLPSKMDKRQEECLDAPHRRLFIFRHCWISRFKPGEYRARTAIYHSVFRRSLSCLSPVSRGRPRHTPAITVITRPTPPSMRAPQNRFFSFHMVFTKDLGNCSLTVRTTSASNAGLADGFVRRAFNETPGALNWNFPAPRHSLSVSTDFPAVSSLLRQLGLCACTCADRADGHVRYRARECTKCFVFSRHRRFPAGRRFFHPSFPSCVIFLCPFSGTHDAFDNSHTDIARVKWRGIGRFDRSTGKTQAFSPPPRLLFGESRLWHQVDELT